jgi:bifunctional non-homologous end joining protein LigD
MLATPGTLPTAAGWALEFKWDGVRAIVRVDRGAVTISSRNDRDMTGSYPELASMEGMGRRRLVLDGEIVALDSSGRPSFSRLQKRMHVVAPAPALRSEFPLRLYVFDLLYLDGDLLVPAPYHRRRELLSQLVFDDRTVSAPPAFDGEKVADAVATATELGLEGIVAKQVDSPYQPGVRSPYWIKKAFTTTVEVVIGGWTPGAGRRAGTIGALLLGMFDEHGRLAYVGQVGTGFTQAMLADLQRMLAPTEVEASPFVPAVARQHAHGAHWVRPELVGEVVYRTLTPDGRLRHPAWRGLRPDRNADEVRHDRLLP